MLSSTLYLQHYNPLHRRNAMTVLAMAMVTMMQEEEGAQQVVGVDQQVEEVAQREEEEEVRQAAGEEAREAAQLGDDMTANEMGMAMMSQEDEEGQVVEEVQHAAVEIQEEGIREEVEVFRQEEYQQQEQDKWMNTRRDYEQAVSILVITAELLEFVLGARITSTQLLFSNIAKL
jgi:hypothetical protein